LEITTQTPSELCPAEGAPPSNDTDPCRLTGPWSEGRRRIEESKIGDKVISLPLNWGTDR
jgi:hypothetical protein